MEFTHLLEKLNELQDKNEKRTDIYLDAMKEYIRSEAGTNWTDRHQKVFDTINSRIHDARIYRWIIIALTVVVFGFIIYLGFNSAYFSNKIKQNMALVELARQSTLPLEIVKLDSTGEWLNVRISNHFSDLSADQKSYLNDLVNTFPSLGRLYGLSSRNDLNVTLTKSEAEKDPVLLISPKNSAAYIGRSDVKSQIGRIWPKSGINSIDALQQFNLKTPIEYLDESGTDIDFYIRKNNYDFNSDRWEVQFAEKDKAWSDKYKIAVSNKGTIENPIFLVFEKGWKNIYAVELGIGGFGSNEDGQYAWHVKSFVRRISFD